MKETYDHGQAVGHGNKIRTTILGGFRRKVAVHRWRVCQRRLPAGKITLVILKPELPRVLAHDLDVRPPELLEALPRNVAEGRREVDEVHAREERGDVDEAGHGLDVVARAAANLPV